MKGLDTNVLVRYLMLDHPEQAELAARVIEDALRTGEPLFVSGIVMCEFVWVLETAYRLPRARVSDALEEVLRSAQLRFAQPALLWQALVAYREGKGDFADYVLGFEGRNAGCESTFTFDRALRASPAFRVLEA